MFRIEEKGRFVYLVENWKVVAEVQVEELSFGTVVHSLRKFYDHPHGIARLMKYVHRKYPTYFCWTDAEDCKESEYLNRLNRIYSSIGRPIGTLYKITKET